MKYKLIPITKDKYCKVSPEDYERLSSMRWIYRRSGYAERWEYINDKKCLKRMHTWIIYPLPGYEVDHINGDKLDNRRENLRACTHKQNCRNFPKFSTNKTGYKGVARNSKKYGGVYRAQIMVNYKQKFLGYYDNPDDAARAYDLAAIQYFGDFARLNFPIIGEIHHTEAV